MATRDIFLCHSKKDRHAILELYRRLIDDGFSVWFDEEEILAGEEWEARIERGVSESQIMLVCFSTTWVFDRSYAHRELTLALDIVKELPENRVFIIPARLDNCSVPQRVRKLQWVNLFEDGGYAKLQKSLRVNLKSRTPVAPATGRDAARALADELGFEFIEIDPFQGDDSDQQELLDYFKHGSPLSKSHDALEAQHFEEIIKIWEYLEGNPYFTVLHPAWSVNSLIRMYVFRAKADLCIAHVHIGVSKREDAEPHFRAGLNILREVAQMPPFSDENSDLPLDIAQIQNNDYRDLCRFVLDWYSKYAILISARSRTPEEDVSAIMGAITHRLGELEKMLSATKKI